MHLSLIGRLWEIVWFVNIYRQITTGRKWIHSLSSPTVNRSHCGSPLAASHIPPFSFLHFLVVFMPGPDGVAGWLYQCNSPSTYWIPALGQVLGIPRWAPCLHHLSPHQRGAWTKNSNALLEEAVALRPVKGTWWTLSTEVWDSWAKGLPLVLGLEGLFPQQNG